METQAVVGQLKQEVSAPVERMRSRDYALVGLFCLLLFGYSGISGRPLTMHESRLPQTAREMLASGQWLFPHSGSRPWLERPPLPHWMVMGADWLFGRSDAVWVVRLPSAAMGTITVLLAAWVAGKWYGRGIGIVSGLVLATSWEFYTYACLAEDDIYLAALVMGAMALFIKGQAEEETTVWGKRKWSVLAFFAVLGLSNLAKGPLVGTAEVCGPIGVYWLLSRDWKGIKKYVWLWGWMVFVVIALAWPVAAYQRYPDVWENWVADYGKKGGQDFGKPFWYPWVTLLWAMAPWTPAMLLGLWETWAKAREEKQSNERFLWCWALVPLVLWSIPSRKHHHYLVPLLAPWAILAARGLVPIARELMAGKGPAWLRRPLFGVLAIGLPGSAALMLLSIYSRIPGPFRMTAILASVWISCTLLWYVGGWRKKPAMMLAAVLTGLCVGYCWGQTCIAAAAEGTAGDMAFLKTVRESVPKEALLTINAKVNPTSMEFFRNQFYLRSDAMLLHNLTYLRDEKIKAEEVYVVTRANDREKLEKLGEVEQIAQSEKTRRERSPADRFTLFKLKFRADLIRYPATQPIGVMEAMERAPGPFLGGPL